MALRLRYFNGSIHCDTNFASLIAVCYTRLINGLNEDYFEKPAEDLLGHFPAGEFGTCYGYFRNFLVKWPHLHPFVLRCLNWVFSSSHSCSRYNVGNQSCRQEAPAASIVNTSTAALFFFFSTFFTNSTRAEVFKLVALVTFFAGTVRLFLVTILTNPTGTCTHHVSALFTNFIHNFSHPLNKQTIST
ncbi:Uncharacterised protein [Lelliottia amnigena]|nr:Uncharacterised protein [Lelliottia amnigena]